MKTTKLENSLLELWLIRGKIKKVDKYWVVKCCTCPTTTHRTNLNWWHCIPQAKGKACKFLLRNINQQCSGCNWKANQWQQHLHALYIANEYWQDVCDDLFVRQHTTFKPTIQRLEDKIQEVIDLIVKWYCKQSQSEKEELIHYIKKDSNRKSKCKQLLERLLN